MLSQDLIVVPTQGRPPAIIESSGRKARDRVEHFLRAAIDNDNTRRAYGRALGSFLAFLEDGGRAHILDIGPLDVRDYLEAAKANGLSTATLKQHMAAPWRPRPPAHSNFDKFPEKSRSAPETWRLWPN